jgi:hypothetical protein
MDFNQSFFERRLAHVLSTMQARTAPPDNGGRGPLRFSRRGPRPPAEIPTPASLAERISALAGELDRLVREYARARRDQPLARIAVAEVEGHLVWSPASDWKLACYYQMAGGLDPGLAQFLRGAIRPADVFLDLGASLGAYTLLGAALTGDQGVVHSVEDAPEAYHWLRENVQAAGSPLAGRVRLEKLRIPSERTVDQVIGPGERVDWARIGGNYPVADVLGGMARVCRENPHCRIIVDYCAALHPLGPNLGTTIDALARMGFLISRIDKAKVGALEPGGGGAEAFSAILLLEQGPEMRWTG